MEAELLGLTEAAKSAAIMEFTAYGTQRWTPG